MSRKYRSNAKADRPATAQPRIVETQDAQGSASTVIVDWNECVERRALGPQVAFGCEVAASVA